MNIKKSLSVLIVGFAILASVSASWAEELRIPLTAVEPHLQAKGTVYLTGNGLSIHAKGLRPGSVYSVWLKEMAYMVLPSPILLLGIGR
jgi:hypothetical protein